MPFAPLRLCEKIPEAQHFPISVISLFRYFVIPYG